MAIRILQVLAKWKGRAHAGRSAGAVGRACYAATDDAAGHAGAPRDLCRFRTLWVCVCVRLWFLRVFLSGLFSGKPKGKLHKGFALSSRAVT